MPFIGSIALSSDKNLDEVILSDKSSFFVNIILKSNSSESSSIRIPVSRGSAFITGVYNQTKPVIRSQIAFEDITKDLIVHCNDGSKWVLYAWPPIQWVKTDMHTLNPVNIDNTWSGVIQIAKLPSDSNLDQSKMLYDRFCGSWSEGLTLDTDFRNDGLGCYTFRHKQYNAAKPTLFHLLPHQLNSVIADDGIKHEKLSLYTPSNGSTTVLSSITGEYLFAYPLPQLSLLPGATNLDSNEKEWLRAQINQELSKDWLTDIAKEASIYFSGKLVGRIANTLLIANYTLEDFQLTKIATKLLTECLDLILGDQRPHPLIYDTTIGGVISSAAHVTNDPIADFGSSFYNDIHFHAAYPVYAGAVLLSLDALSHDLKEKILDMINSVNSTETTQRFCAYRAFDWYVGHSWARGYLPSADGKDEESTTEAAHFYYSAALFSDYVGASKQSYTSRLQLSLMQESTKCYRLLDDSNEVMPFHWRGNRVGMCFENKRDHGTWFSPNIECIHGIHMLPLSPLTSFIRSPEFISQEFESHLRSIFPTNTGWDAIILTNWAFSDNQRAVKYAKEWIETAPDSSFDPGLSRSWAWLLAVSNIE
ncbi:glycoside hydrolase [Wallemia mellicola]|uniref:glucan endo-1,3-beta-D-glucosidase n=1 Tax=Wallemia mellicola TaxID=1708541 RepID=A0AB74KIU2_9BASI|nr:glycoside hydrolase [Wallemia mellicola]